MADFTTDEALCCTGVGHEGPQEQGMLRQTLDDDQLQNLLEQDIRLPDVNLDEIYKP